jgi:hypothetical protein
MFRRKLGPDLIRAAHRLVGRNTRHCLIPGDSTPLDPARNARAKPDVLNLAAYT